MSLVMAAVLVTAAVLEPSAEGMGTHEQLGLSPCFFPEKLGYPCPACGMTTSWAHLMDGNVHASAEVNLGGFLLAVTCLFCVPWFMISAIKGRWIFMRMTDGRILVFLVSWLLVTMADWVIRRLLI
ncbi:MAG: hypothetical protein CMJ76_08530 [Planctomycetaceae bacterium]|nr:hypothetical protein [Planctomycetaceae bacterium]